MKPKAKPGARAKPKADGKTPPGGDGPATAGLPGTRFRESSESRAWRVSGARKSDLFDNHACNRACAVDDIPFVRESGFEYGVVQWLSPGLRRVVARNPSPYTQYGTNTFTVGEGTVAIIDPGPALEEHVEAVLKAVSGETVSHVFVTHTHRDHSPAADILKAGTGARTCGFGPHPTGRPEHGGGAPVENGADTSFCPDIRLADGDVVTGPGWTLTAIHTPGHMSNLMCYAWREGDVLFSGDHVMAWSTSVIAPPDGSLSAYLASLEKVRRRRERLFLPGHGPAITDPRSVVQAHIDHRHERTRQILAALEDGTATIPALVRRIYPLLSPDLVEGAGLSVLAHLIDLRLRGRVTAAGDEWRLVPSRRGGTHHGFATMGGKPG